MSGKSLVVLIIFVNLIMWAGISVSNYLEKDKDFIKECKKTCVNVLEVNPKENICKCK